MSEESPTYNTGAPAQPQPKPIYLAIAQLPEADDERLTGLSLIEVAHNMQLIGDPNQEAKAVEWLARARKVYTELDTRRKNMNAGAREAIERLNAEFATILSPLQKECEGMEKLILAYRERERNRIEAERRAIEQREAQQAEFDRQQRQEAAARGAPPPPKVVTIVEPKPAPPPARVLGHAGSSATEKEVWTYEIVDITLVPESYLVPKEDRVQKSVLNAMAKSQKAGASVPGIRFYPKSGLTTKAAK